MSVIIFLVVLVVLVLVHEWGHFIVAKKTGMRVDEFGIGFPPKAFGIKRGETEYTLNWLPIGGFVRIYGENLDEAERIGEENPDSKRAFSARPKWAQALVLVAGVAMNIIFAWFLLIITLMIGVPTAVDETTASDQAVLYVAGTVESGPATSVPDGASIVGVTTDSKNLESLKPQAFTNFVSEVAPAPITLSYEFDGEVAEAVIVPEQGLLEDDADRYIVGVSLALVEIQKASFFEAIVDGSKMTVDIFWSIVVGLLSLIGQSIAGTADYSQVAGPVGIVGMVGDAAAFGITALLTFTAVISLNLAVINLLPFPALDGGRLVFVAIEAVTGKHIPAEWAGRVNFFGFILLMLLMVAVTYNDIIRLL